MARPKVTDNRVPGGVLDVVVGAEPEVVILFLRRCVHPAPLIAGERALLVVARHQVLTQLWTYGLQHVTRVTEQREVAQQRMVTLPQVTHRHGGSSQGRCSRYRPRRPPHALILLLGHTGRQGEPVTTQIQSSAVSKSPQSAGSSWLEAHVGKCRFPCRQQTSGLENGRPRGVQLQDFNLRPLDAHIGGDLSVGLKRAWMK
jgi:hypothetical protein